MAALAASLRAELTRGGDATCRSAHAALDAQGEVGEREAAHNDACEGKPHQHHGANHLAGVGQQHPCHAGANVAAGRLDHAGLEHEVRGGLGAGHHDREH